MIPFGDATVGTPPGDVFKMAILERREQAVEAIEVYELANKIHGDASIKLDIAWTRMRSYWRQIRAMACRRLKDGTGSDDDPTYEQVENAMMAATTFEEIDAAVKWMCVFLDEVGLTRSDTKRNYEDLDIEEANELEGV